MEMEEVLIECGKTAGNVNVSLLTSQKAHCRKRNLSWIADSLNARFRVNVSLRSSNGPCCSVQVEPTSRDDLEMQPGRRKCSGERKKMTDRENDVTGTAARIARGRAYHHMTMLVDVDLSVLSGMLRSPIEAFLHPRQ